MGLYRCCLLSGASWCAGHFASSSRSHLRGAYKEEAVADATRTCTTAEGVSRSAGLRTAMPIQATDHDGQIFLNAIHGHANMSARKVVHEYNQTGKWYGTRGYEDQNVSTPLRPSPLVEPRGASTFSRATAEVSQRVRVENGGCSLPTTTTILMIRRG